MKKILLVLSCVLSATVLYAQNTDSLKAILPDLPDDTSKVISLVNVAQKILDNEPSEALKYAQQALSISQKLKYTYGTGLSFKLMADSYKVKGNMDTAIYYYTLAKEDFISANAIRPALFADNGLSTCYISKGNYEQGQKIAEEILKKGEALGDKKIIASAHMRIGNCLSEMGNHPESINHSLQAARIYEELNDTKSLAIIYNNVASSFKDINDFKSALDYNLKALELKKKLDSKRSLAFTYSNLGILYRHMGQYDSAMKNMNMSLSLRRELGDKKGISQDLQNLGVTYRNLKQYDKAKKSYLEALALKKETGDKKGEAIVYYNLAQLFYDLDNMTEAKKYLEKSEAITSNIKVTDLLAEIFALRSQVQEKMSDQKDALENLRKSVRLKDSLLNADRTKQIIELQTKYETEKKDKELAINKLTIEQNEAELQRKTFSNYVLVGGIAALALVMIFGVGYFFQRQKAMRHHEELEKQKAILQERNRIAADMHDDLGSGLLKIKMMAEAVAIKSNGNTEEVKKISGSADELADNLRQIIWAMGGSNNSLEDLILYIRRYGYEFFENSGIELQMSVPENIPAVTLTSEQRRNIFLVLKESLNNILKHSGASTATISTVFDSGINFSISDNGKGINTDSQNRFGNGLLNMKKRMESIGGTFLMENKNGTSVTFSIPLEASTMSI